MKSTAFWSDLVWIEQFIVMILTIDLKNHFEKRTSIEVKSSQNLQLRDGWWYQNGWIFRKVPRGGRGSFSIKNSYCRFWTFIQVFFGEKKCNMIFRKWWGGSQRPLGIFPKIHPFWYPYLIVIAVSSFRHYYLLLQCEFTDLNQNQNDRLKPFQNWFLSNFAEILFPPSNNLELHLYPNFSRCCFISEKR